MLNMGFLKLFQVPEIDYQDISLIEVLFLDFFQTCQIKYMKSCLTTMNCAFVGMGN